MSVIPFTVFFSLLLAGLFVVLFAREQRRRFGSPERDSLLPLADEIPRAVGPNLRGAPVPPAGHGPGRCTCRSGQRTPCAECLRRRDEQDPSHF